MLWNVYCECFVMSAKGKGGRYWYMCHVFGIPAVDILLIEPMKRGMLIGYSREGLEAWFLFLLLRSLKNIT